MEQVPEAETKPTENRPRYLGDFFTLFLTMRGALTLSDKLTVPPIIKWAGGKRQLLPELKSRLPEQFNRYFEPFIGGGALFFDLSPFDAYISDINPELVNLYTTIRDNVDELIDDLSWHKNSEEYFKEIRDWDRRADYLKISPVRRASRFIYLNKTCFNGLYRVNNKGQFNVPFGKYAKPNLINKEALHAASEMLQAAKIACASFVDILPQVRFGDFVYFDPPYIPVSKTASFTSYCKEDFGTNEQMMLRALCDQLTAIGVKFMLSNSDTPAAHELYKGYRVEKISANRCINSKADNRKKITEVIVRNY